MRVKAWRIARSPTPREYNNTLLLTYRHLAEQPHPLLNVPEKKFSMPTVQLLMY